MPQTHVPPVSAAVPRRAPTVSRRHFLRGAFALATASLVTPTRGHLARAQVRFTGYPFTLGVASGCPQPESVVLWTRLAPEPLNGGGVEPGRVEVQWELAHDENFHDVVQKGSVWTAQELGHSVHAEVDGLEPGRWYWYRFTVRDEVSPVGRTRTAPAPNAPLARFRLAVGSCQHYEQGYFSAYRYMAEDDVDLVVFVGDYIYESSWGEQLVRRHSGPEPQTLRATLILLCLLHRLTVLEQHFPHCLQQVAPELQHPCYRLRIHMVTAHYAHAQWIHLGAHHLGHHLAHHHRHAHHAAAHHRRLAGGLLLLAAHLVLSTHLVLGAEDRCADQDQRRQRYTNHQQSFHLSLPSAGPS
jgi:PhoD-like phosphatase, N-terminal domain/PhoD-like phosphatase